MIASAGSAVPGVCSGCQTPGLNFHPSQTAIHSQKRQIRHINSYTSMVCCSTTFICSSSRFALQVTSITRFNASLWGHIPTITTNNNEGKGNFSWGSLVISVSLRKTDRFALLCLCLGLLLFDGRWCLEHRKGTVAASPGCAQRGLELRWYAREWRRQIKIWT